MSLVRAVYLGMAIVVPFVFVVLVLSTDNLLLALYSTLTILGIVTTVIGIGASGLQGWDLGTAEAIAAIIIIGFSVDYCVHIANAYMESGASTRWARMRIALTTMGISVTAGAITTRSSCPSRSTHLLFSRRMLARAQRRHGGPADRPA